MAGYIGDIPVPQATQTRQTFTATASQTSFPTIGYTAGFIDVYLNGIKLLDTVDYAATNGSDVVLTTGAALNDILEVTIFDTFTTSDNTTTNATHTSATLKSNVTLKNDTEEDSDGGRASKIIYQGEQSGGEITTLAEIQASHDGTADDQKGDLIFRTNDGSDGTSPTEAMRIQSDQSVLFGSATTDDDQKIQMIKTGGSVGLGLHSNRAAVGGSALILSHNRNTSIGSFTALNDDDQLGRITFQGSDGTDIKTEGAQIHAEINGTVGSNDLPTELVFSTTADGASAITERLRITREGYIRAGAIPAFHAKGLANTQSSAGTSNGNEVLVFNAATTNNGSHYNTGNGRFTAPCSGLFYFGFSLLYDNSYSNNGSAYLRKNGSAVGEYAYVEGDQSADYFQVAGSAVVTMSESDYVDIYTSIAGWHIASETSFTGFMIG
jgi:hypothetical protein